MTPYIEALSRALSEVGIRGRQRARILAEFRDHLECEPNALLGSTDDLARQFADELGTARARRAGLTAFAALAAVGVLVAIAFLSAQVNGFRVANWGSPGTPLLDLGLGFIAIGAQVAFVSGLLGLVRAVRLRTEPILARREAVLISRRAMIGLVAGFACLAGLGLVAIELGAHMPAWWQPLALGATGLSACLLAAAVPAVGAAMRLAPTGGGAAGDLFDDLGPFVPPPLRGRPWLFALIVAAALGGAIALLGASQNDPFDGLARGLADGAACLAGFAVLGPYLGLWGTPAE